MTSKSQQMIQAVQMCLLNVTYVSSKTTNIRYLTPILDLDCKASEVGRIEYENCLQNIIKIGNNLFARIRDKSQPAD